MAFAMKTTSNYYRPRQTKLWPKYPDSKLKEAIKTWDFKIQKLRHFHSSRTQKYIVIVTDEREHLDFSLAEYGETYVDVICVPNMKITTVFSTIKTHPKFDKGTIFVLSGGTHDLLQSSYLPACIEACCKFPVSLLSLPTLNSYEGYDVHYLIRKALNLHFNILHFTQNDIAIFSGLLPVSINHYNNFNIEHRACQSIHSISEIPIAVESDYRTALRLFNDFTKYHAQSLGYEPWDLEMVYFSKRSEPIFLPDGYHINCKEDIRRAERVKLLCEGIFPLVFSPSKPKVSLEETDLCKVFINLRDVTPERGIRYLEQFGTIVDSHFKVSSRNPNALFGSIIFSEARTVEDVLRLNSHKIDGVPVRIQRWCPPYSSTRTPNSRNFSNEPENKYEKIPLLELPHHELEWQCQERDFRHQESGLQHQVEAIEGSSSVAVPQMEGAKYVDVKCQRIGFKFKAQFYEILKLQEKRVQNNIVVVTDERNDFDVNLVGVNVMKIPTLKFQMALSEIKNHPKFGTGTLFVFSGGIHDLLHSSLLLECLSNFCESPQKILTLPSYNGDHYYLIKKALRLHLELLSTTQNDTALFCGIVPVSIDKFNACVVEFRPCISKHSARHVQEGDLYRYQNYLDTIKLYNYFIKYHAQILAYKPWDIERSYFKKSREFNVLKRDCYNISKESNSRRSKEVEVLCKEILLTKFARSTVLDSSVISRGNDSPFAKNWEIEFSSEERISDEQIIFLNYERVTIITDSRYLPFLEHMKRPGVHFLFEKNIEIEDLKEFFLRKRKNLTARTLYLFVVGIHSVVKTGPLHVCQSLGCNDPLESLESWDHSELAKFTPDYAKKLKHLLKKANLFIPRQSNIAVLPPLPVSLICENLPHVDLHINKSQFLGYKILQRMSMVNRLYPEWVHKFTLTAISSITSCTCVQRASFNKLNADNGKLEVMECNANKDRPSYNIWKEVVNEVVEIALKKSGSKITREKIPLSPKQWSNRGSKDLDTHHRNIKNDPQESIYEEENVSRTLEKASDLILQDLNFNDNDSRKFIRFIEAVFFLNKKYKEENGKDFDMKVAVTNDNKPKSKSTRISDKTNDASSNKSSLKNNLGKTIHTCNHQEDIKAKTVVEKRRPHRPLRKVVFVGGATSLELLPEIDICSVSKWYDGDIVRKEKLLAKINKLNGNAWKEVTFIFICDLRMLGCHEKSSTCLLRKCKRPLTQIKASGFRRSEKYGKMNVIKGTIENAMKEIAKLSHFVPKFFIAPFTPCLNVQVSSSSAHSEMHDYVTCLNNVYFVPGSNQLAWKELLEFFAKDWNDYSIKESEKDPVVIERIKSFLSENGNPVSWKNFSSKELDFSDCGTALMRWKACIRWMVSQSPEENLPQINKKCFHPKNVNLKKKQNLDVAEEKGLVNSGSSQSKSFKMKNDNFTENSPNFVQPPVVKKELISDSIRPIPFSDSHNLVASELVSNKNKSSTHLTPIVKGEEAVIPASVGSNHKKVSGDPVSTIEETVVEIKEVAMSDLILPKDIGLYQNFETKVENLNENYFYNNNFQNSSTASNEEIVKPTSSLLDTSSVTSDKNKTKTSKNEFLNSDCVTQNLAVQIKEEKVDSEYFDECNDLDFSKTNFKTPENFFQIFNCSTIKDEEFLSLGSPLPVLLLDNSKEAVPSSSHIKDEFSDMSLSPQSVESDCINSPNPSKYFETESDIDHLVVIGNSAAQEFLDTINFLSTSHWKFDNIEKLFQKMIDLSYNFKSVLFIIFCDISTISVSTKTNSTITDVRYIISTIYQYCCVKRKVILAPFNPEIALKKISASQRDKSWELSILSFSEEWENLICQAQRLENLFLNNTLTQETFPIDWNNLSSPDSSIKEVENVVLPISIGSSNSQRPRSNLSSQVKLEISNFFYKKDGLYSKEQCRDSRLNSKRNSYGDSSSNKCSENKPIMIPPVNISRCQKRSRSKSTDPISFKKLRTSTFPLSSTSDVRPTEAEFTPAFRNKIGFELIEKFTLRLNTLKQTFEEKFKIYEFDPETHPRYEKYHGIFDQTYENINEKGNEQRKEYLWKAFWKYNFESIRRDDWQIEFSSLKREFEDFVSELFHPADPPNCQTFNHPPSPPVTLQPPISLSPPATLPSSRAVTLPPPPHLHPPAVALPTPSISFSPHYFPISHPPLPISIPHQISLFPHSICNLPPSFISFPSHSIPPPSPSIPPPSPSIPPPPSSIPPLPQSLSPPSLLDYLNQDSMLA